MWRTIGQPSALSLLEHSLRMSNLAHAYLFVGPPHVGKTTLALDLAQAVNCQGDKPPCGECYSCRRIIDGKHTDVMVLDVNSARDPKDTKPRTEISIKAIWNLQRSASLPPYEGRYKVFIIDGAECLSDEAANCLLKTLEEPPSAVIVLLLTAEEVRLLPTVISRCQRVELKPVPRTEIETLLREQRGVDGDRAKLLARLSQGGLGWALRAAIDEAYLAQWTQRLSEMFSLLNASLEERFVYAARQGNDRKSAQELIDLWLLCWRDLMLTKCGVEQAITNVDRIPTIEGWAQTLTLLQTKDFINSLQKSLRQISLNANLQLVFETLMLDMPRKEGKTGHTIPPLPVSL